MVIPPNQDHHANQRSVSLRIHIFSFNRNQRFKAVAVALWKRLKLGKQRPRAGPAPLHELPGRGQQNVERQGGAMVEQTLGQMGGEDALASARVSHKGARI